MSSSGVTKNRVDWKQVGLFLGLTFAISYSIDLVMYLRGGLTGAGTFELLQLRMLVPALVAMVLGMFVFKDSPFHVSRLMPNGRRDRARGFFYLFMAMTLVFIAISVLSVAAPAEKTLLAILKQVALLEESLAFSCFASWAGERPSLGQISGAGDSSIG